MVIFDRDDFVHNLADEVSKCLSVNAEVLALKKDGSASVSFLYQNTNFSVSVDVCETSSLQVTLFYGKGVDLLSTPITPTFKMQEYSAESYFEFLERLFEKVNSLTQANVSVPHGHAIH